MPRLNGGYSISGFLIPIPSLILILQIFKSLDVFQLSLLSSNKKLARIVEMLSTQINKSNKKIWLDLSNLLKCLANFAPKLKAQIGNKNNKPKLWCQAG